MSRELHIVSHSHWDREWHQTFQQFRLRLVRLIDQVLNVVRDDPSFSAFMLDGQTILLEDYVEIRPERAGELRARIAEGRLLIGPWYVHPDEFLVSGEALVRNLLLGDRLCREWGGRMAIGYVPDQFGHIAQLPQIWRGFGIDTGVLWRGVDRAEARTAFTWQGHDGSRALVAALPDGYNQAEYLPAGGQALAERLQALAASLEAPAGEGRPLLIMNGGDHALVQPELPAALRTAEEVLGDRYTVLHSTLPAYIAALREAGTPPAVIEGELRNSRSAFLLPGVLSSRMWIKQRNAALQTLLERQAEPLATVAAALGVQYPAGELRQSWRYLLQNHPHDSICGCSIDQVHREMATRFDWSEQIAGAIRDQSQATLAAQVDSVVPGAEDPRALAITVFNGATVAQGGRIELALRLAGEAASYEVVDSEGAPVPHAWLGEHGEPPTNVEMPIADAPDRDTVLAQLGDGDRVMGLGILDLSMRTVGTTLQVEITVGDQALLSRRQIEEAVHDAYVLVTEAACTRISATIYRSAELQLALLVPEVPACGYRTLLLRPRAKTHATPEQAGAAPELLPMIENERYRVEADPITGALTITERASGLRLGPANYFLDGGEAGDLYTHCPPSIDRQVGAQGGPAIERESGPLGQSLRMRLHLEVPAALAPSRFERAAETVALPIETTVSLAPGDALVRFDTTVENRADDHRLRAYFALPFAVDHVHAEDAFALVRRAAQPDRSGDWAEEPAGTAPHQGVVALHGATGSFLLAARGLPEYEVLPKTEGGAEIALTLLRCTGWLSRSDIPTRPADAGPSLPTPEGQCHGTYSLSYALAFGAEDWRALLPAARAFAVDLHATVAPCAEGHLPARASMVEVSPHAVVPSALKGAEDGRGAILRVYNDDTVAHTATVRLLLPIIRATLTDLAEQDGAVLFEGAARTEIAVEAPAGGIVSVRLEWAA